MTFDISDTLIVLFTYLLTYRLSVYLSVCLFVCLFVYLFVCVNVYVCELCYSESCCCDHGEILTIGLGTSK